MPVSRVRDVCLVSGISVVAIATALIVGAQAEPNAGPPDFASLGEMAWYHDGVNLTRVPDFPGPLRDDPAHHHIDNTGGGEANYSIADLSDPNLTQWAKDIMKKDNEEVLAGKIAFLPHQSCVPAGASMFDMVRGPIPIYFIQSPKEVLIIWPGDHQVRHIYLNVPHSKNPKPSWYGESVGHYEGNTLVIDTIGETTRTFVDNYRTPHSDRLHVQERWTLEDAKTLRMTLVVDDPAAYREPWAGTRTFHRVQQPMIESSCAENNQHFEFHIPVADKADF